MKKTLRILAVAIFSLILFQNCQKSDFIIVTGVVTDSLTNKPIEGVYVYADGHSYKTASDGTFSIEGIAPGKTNFWFYNFNGYKQETKSVVISNGRVTKINILLTPIINPQIETGKVFNITGFNAQVTGILKLSSDVSVSQYGHCWSPSNSLPTLEDNVGRTLFNGSTTNYTSSMTGLLADNLYFVRSFAITSSGTVIYGNTLVFRTVSLQISDGLISYFPFNGNFYDESGSGYNYIFSYLAQLTSDRFGNPNSAFASMFNRYLYLYSYDGRFSKFDQFSISFWFYKSSWAGTDIPILGCGYPAYINEIKVGEDASSGKIYFDIKTGGGSLFKVTANSAPSLNQWHHVVARRNSSQIQLFIDGVLKGTTNCDNQPIVLDQYSWGYGYFFLGSYYNPGWSWFNGHMDEIRIYNRALTDSEVQYLSTN